MVKGFKVGIASCREAFGHYMGGPLQLESGLVVYHTMVIIP